MLVKQQLGNAFEAFLKLAGSSTHAAKTRLATEGATIRFDSRDVANDRKRRDYVMWTPPARAEGP